MKVNFCPHCYSQVRWSGEAFIGYNDECVCIEGLEKDKIISILIPGDGLKDAYGFVTHNSNSLLTYSEATKIHIMKPELV